jgi:hypothetical protein
LSAIAGIGADSSVESRSSSATIWRISVSRPDLIDVDADKVITMVPHEPQFNAQRNRM